MNRLLSPCRAKRILPFFALLSAPAATLIWVSELLAQQDFNFNNQGGQGDAAAAAAFMMVMLVVIGVSLVVGLAIQIFICYLLFSLQNAVPPQFRTFQPGMVWLLMIPCFALVWNFFVYIPISKSYQNYFRSIGRYDVGDCGEQLGLWFCVCVCLNLVPFVNYIAGPAAFIMMIIFLVKMFGLKGQIQATGTQPKWGTV